MGETEGRGRDSKQAERRQSEKTLRESKMGKKRAGGAREEGRGRAREKGAGSGLPGAERTALKTPAGCGPPAAPSRIPDPRLQGRPLPGSVEGPSPAGSTPPPPSPGPGGAARCRS